MTANQRSTAWPLSDICNVTGNQRSTGQLSAAQSGVNCSMEEKVNVAVCDSRSSIYNIIVYNIIFVYNITAKSSVRLRMAVAWGALIGIGLLRVCLPALPWFPVLCVPTVY